MLEAEQILLDTIFENPKVVALKILDNLPLIVENGDVERDFFDVGAHDETATLLGNFSGRGFRHVRIWRPDRVAVHGKRGRVLLRRLGAQGPALKDGRDQDERGRPTSRNQEMGHPDFW